MREKPRVSCIIIFLNAERFLAEAVESVLGQTYTNWELLLVDDGSTDASTSIARNYAAKKPGMIRYLEHEGHENRGMSRSRNLGIRYVRGQFVAFLDSDDVWLPNKLEEQVPLLECHSEAAMLYGRTKYWVSWTGRPEDRDRDGMTRTSGEFDCSISPPKQLLLFLEDGGETYPCMCSVLIRREVFDELGGFEDEFRDANEDMAFHAKVFLNRSVFVSSKCWDYYRIHRDSYWQSAPVKVRSDNHSVELLRYLKWLESYLVEQQNRDAAVWTSLRRACFSCEHPRLVAVQEFAENPLKTTANFFRRVVRRTMPAGIRVRLKTSILGSVISGANRRKGRRRSEGDSGVGPPACPN